MGLQSTFGRSVASRPNRGRHEISRHLCPESLPGARPLGSYGAEQLAGGDLVRIWILAPDAEPSARNHPYRPLAFGHVSNPSRRLGGTPSRHDRSSISVGSRRPRRRVGRLGSSRPWDHVPAEPGDRDRRGGASAAIPFTGLVVSFSVGPGGLITSRPPGPDRFVFSGHRNRRSLPRWRG